MWSARRAPPASPGRGTQRAGTPTARPSDSSCEAGAGESRCPQRRGLGTPFCLQLGSEMWRAQRPGTSRQVVRAVVRPLAREAPLGELRRRNLHAFMQTEERKVATIEATHLGSAVGACAFAEAGAAPGLIGVVHDASKSGCRGPVALHCPGLAPAAAATTRRRGDGEAEQKAQHACKRCATRYNGALHGRSPRAQPPRRCHSSHW